jgi:hypothetical protein
MTEIQAPRVTAPSQTAPRTPYVVDEGPSASTGSSGWVTFAAVVMLVAGIARVLDGVWAFHYNRAVPDNLQGALFGNSLSTYAWTWIAVGGLLIFVGLGYLGIGWLAGTQLGRWTGIIAAGLGGLTAMEWMPYYPVWTLLYVGIAVVVIYALVVHPHPGARPKATAK